MITLRKRWPALIGAIVLSVVLASNASGQTNESGRDLPADCRVNVAINTGREFPSRPIEVIVNHGGTVLVTPVGDEDSPALTVQLTVTGWSMYESSAWGDVRDFETECGLPSTMPSTVHLPMVGN